MLLVDDHKAEALEVDRFGQQPMGSDDDVDGAGVDAGHRLCDFLARAKARKLGDLYWPVGEAIAKRLHVLLGQQGGRTQHGHLFAVDNGGERRA